MIRFSSKNFLKKKFNFVSIRTLKTEIKQDKTQEHTEEGKQEFEKRLNTLSTSEPNDIENVEQYVKIFNDKIYKQNLDLTNKLNDIFKDDTPSTTKIFTAINEINKINLNNSSKLLQVFLNQILKYNDSVRLFIQQTQRKNNKYNFLTPITILLIWICGGIFLYNQFKHKLVNYDNLIEKAIREYTDSASEIFKLNKKFPINDDHKNITNSINFDQFNNLVLIGPSGIGKSESVKHFCFTQNQKDVVTFYIDLNSEKTHNNLHELITSKILSFSKNEISNTDAFSKHLINHLNSKQVLFVFDNFNFNRDNQIYFEKFNQNIKNNTIWKSIVITNNNNIYEKSVRNNLGIKYINFTQTRNFKNYLLEKINIFTKKRTEFSNLETFKEENLNSIYKNLFYFSYNDMISYLASNSNVESKYIYKILKNFRFPEKKRRIIN